MLRSPAPPSFDLLGTAKVVAVLRLLAPLALRARLARLPASLLGAKNLSRSSKLRGKEELVATGTLTKTTRGRHRPTLSTLPLRSRASPPAPAPAARKKRRRTVVDKGRKKIPPRA